MKGHATFLAFCAVLAASGGAHAQSAGEGEGGSSPPSWAPVAGERHVVARAQGGVGLRLFDPWGSGALAPGWVHAQAGYLFLNAGPFRMGPSLGAQLGIDPRSAPQFTAQPGWLMMARFNTRFGMLLRADVPVLITRGPNPDREAYRVPDPPPASQPGERTYVLAPFERPYTASLGLELGAAGAFYLTSGFALTAELNAGVYFGDSGFTYPLLGVGLGAMIDYELLP